MAMARPVARGRGITLPELLVVIAVFALLAALAAPSLNGFFVTNRIAAATNDFVTALTLARGEASTRGVTVTLRRTSAVSRDWGGGWELFVDTDGDGLRDASAGSSEVVLRSGLPQAAPVTMFSSLAAADSIRFRPNGRVVSSAAGTALFMICHDGVVAADGQPRSRAVLVSDSGRIRVATTNAAGQPLNDLGAAVASCTAPS